MRKLILLCTCIILSSEASSAQSDQTLQLPYSEIAANEVVEFFRTTAWLNEETDEWHVPIRGWIYEPENSRTRKAIFAAVLEEEFGLETSKATEANFSRRLNLLIADNERDKHIVINILDMNYTLPASGVNGHFASMLTIPTSIVDEHTDSKSISYIAVTRPADRRQFSGNARLVTPTGVSVISDIDDTVKISHVTDKKKLLNQTFFLDFAAVPGMAPLYTTWKEQGIEVHFVSSSPWQLYAPLQEFLKTAGFPESSLNLKAVRFRDSSLLDLFKKGTETKPAAIEKILNAYPKRQFVLVGDSGEQDPEVYAELLRKHPEQIVKVYIRNVTGETPGNDRFKSVFKNIDPDCWALFDSPATLSLP